MISDNRLSNVYLWFFVFHHNIIFFFTLINYKIYYSENIMFSMENFM